MNQHYPFVNTPLPYSYDALEPYIDSKTMFLHHDKHLQTYINNLNTTLREYPDFQSWTLQELLTHMPSLPEPLRQSLEKNGGGVFNHRFYFSNLVNPAPSSPTGFLIDAITRQYGSYEQFQKQFKVAAQSVFGSGYAWLVLDATGHLLIITTPNQKTPFPLGMYPLLNVDVWEHAYYLKHYNQRSNYLDDWFHVIHWHNVNQSYMKCFQMKE